MLLLRKLPLIFEACDVDLPDTVLITAWRAPGLSDILTFTFREIADSLSLLPLIDTKAYSEYGAYV